MTMSNADKDYDAYLALGLDSSDLGPFTKGRESMRKELAQKIRKLITEGIGDAAIVGGILLWIEDP